MRNALVIDGEALRSFLYGQYDSTAHRLFHLNRCGVHRRREKGGFPRLR